MKTNQFCKQCPYKQGYIKLPENPCPRCEKSDYKIYRKMRHTVYGEDDVMLDAGDVMWYLKQVMAGTKNAADNLADVFEGITEVVEEPEKETCDKEESEKAQAENTSICESLVDITHNWKYCVVVDGEIIGGANTYLAANSVGVRKLRHGDFEVVENKAISNNMTYCISDIHGCYDEFMELLEQIDFKPTDTLYILGDVVDRGPEPIKCLQFIMDTPNIYMIRGNHESWMLWNHHAWLDNGGGITNKQYNALPKIDQDKISDFIKKLPLHYTLEIGSKTYILVHAGVRYSTYNIPRVLVEEDYHNMTKLPENLSIDLDIREEFYLQKASTDYTIIFGHTPTQNLHQKKVIWHDSVYKDKICIDCGCCFGGQLAALRLDDMKEFYTNRRKVNTKKWNRLSPLEKVGVGAATVATVGLAILFANKEE